MRHWRETDQAEQQASHWLYRLMAAHKSLCPYKHSADTER